MIIAKGVQTGRGEFSNEGEVEKQKRVGKANGNKAPSGNVWRGVQKKLSGTWVVINGEFGKSTGKKGKADEAVRA